MLRGLERLIKENGNEFIRKDIMQIVKSLSPKEVMWLYRFFLDAVRYELRGSFEKEDYSELDKVVERNKEKVRKGKLVDSHPKVVLLVVGYREYPPMYHGHTDYFRKHGIAQTYWIPLLHSEDTQTNAKNIIRVTEHLLEVTGKDKADVIPHSWGGVVTNYAAKERPDIFDKIINVGTPNNGTLATNIAYKALETIIGKRGIKLMESAGYSLEPIREMMYCSKFTQKLIKDVSKVKDVDFYSIYTHYDEAVVPAECAIVDSSNFTNINVDEFLNLKGVGHIGLAKKREVWELKRDILLDNFDKERYKKEHPIITFEEYRKRRKNSFKRSEPVNETELVAA